MKTMEPTTAERPMGAGEEPMSRWTVVVVVALAAIAIGLATWLVIEMNASSDLEADLRAEQVKSASLRGDLIVERAAGTHPSQARVDALVADFREALVSADADAVAALFTVGASNTSPLGETTYGSVAIGRMYAALGPMATEVLGPAVTHGEGDVLVTALPGRVAADDGLFVARIVDIDGTLLFTDVLWFAR
jgi:hypothetical protein